MFPSRPSRSRLRRPLTRASLISRPSTDRLCRQLHAPVRPRKHLRTIQRTMQLCCRCRRAATTWRDSRPIRISLHRAAKFTRGKEQTENPERDAAKRRLEVPHVTVRVPNSPEQTVAKDTPDDTRRPGHPHSNANPSRSDSRGTVKRSRDEGQTADHAGGVEDGVHGVHGRARRILARRTKNGPPEGSPFDPSPKPRVQGRKSRTVSTS